MKISAQFATSLQSGERIAAALGAGCFRAITIPAQRQRCRGNGRRRSTSTTQ
jgi:hypothetical protein